MMSKELIIFGLCTLIIFTLWYLTYGCSCLFESFGGSESESSTTGPVAAVQTLHHAQVGRRRTADVQKVSAPGYHSNTNWQNTAGAVAAKTKLKSGKVFKN